MIALTQKQIRILKVLGGRYPVIAPWNHADLWKLRDARLAEAQMATSPTGGGSSKSIWTITDAGREFLAAELRGASHSPAAKRRWEPDF